MTKPDFSKDELKMPAEVFGTSASKPVTSHMGIILGVLIVILICILGGLYMWAEILQKNSEAVPTSDALRPTAEENNEPESNNAEADVETLGAMSTSNELEQIEADLESTIIQELDVNLNAIDAELQ